MNEFTKKTVYSELAKKYHADALEALKEFIAINSVYDEKTVSKEAPFGQGVRQALDYIGELATKLGFNVDYCDHYCTEISYGEGELLDIYAHADVVPVSQTWVHSPFEAVVEDGVVYGRGTSDDKGPAIACLYSLKLLLDEGYLGGYKVRMVIGGNEETGSRCLEYYFHDLKKEYPKYGFTPDGDFPLIYAEKGIYTYIHEFEIPEFADAFGFGEALNIVLADVSIKLEVPSSRIEDEIATYIERHPEVKLSYLDDVLRIQGKASHGSLPWMGINAGLHLLNFIGKIKGIDELCNIFRMYCHGDGRPFGGDYTSKNFSDSSYCIGKMNYDGKKLTLYVNMRLPETVKPDVAINNVETKLGGRCTYLGGSAPLLIDPESKLVQLLLQAYQKETGDYSSKPLAIGGGTYAKESKNTLAFGSTFPGRDNRIHDDDEYITLDDFYNSIAVYAHGINDLAGELTAQKLDPNYRHR